MANSLPSLELRAATEADLLLIEQWLVQNHLPTEDISQILASLYLGTHQDTVVGIGGIERHGNDGLLRSVVIADAFRQQGYGQRLCDLMIQKARAEGIQAVYLLTNTADTFFVRLGFEPINRHSAPVTMQNTKEFSSLCPDSAVCMRLYLADLT